MGAVSVKTSHTFRIQVIRLHILQLEPVYFRLLPFHQVLLTRNLGYENLCSKHLSPRNLVPEKYGPQEIWAPMNFIVCHFHAGTLFLLAHIFQEP